MVSDNFFISVIIPTYNGSQKIVRCLNALAKQTRLPNEVIVVIDGSTDDTQEILNALKIDLNIQVIVQDNLGRSASRNSGVGKAKGNLLIYFDDDIRPSSESIERHVNVHAKNQSIVISGQILEDTSLSDKDIFRFKAYLSQKWTSKYHEGINQLSHKNLFLTAANLSVRKEDFEKLGGFDSRLKDAEDFDLAMRALNAGMNVLFDKSNIAWHDDVITCKAYIQRQKQYQGAYNKLIQINPSYKDLVGERKLNLNFLKRSIYFVLSWKFWVDQIDKNRLTILPKKIRYRFYDIVITGLSKIYPNRIS